MIAALLSIGLIGSLLLPQEHVHRTDSDHQSSVTVHRHFDDHHEREDHRERDEPSVDHDGESARWIASAVASPRNSRPAAPMLVLVAHPEAATEPAAESGRLSQGTSRLSVHDPPFLRITGLRAPPSRV